MNLINILFQYLASVMNSKVYESPGIPMLRVKSFEEYLNKPCPSSIYLHDCYPTEINEIISNLENGKSSDIPIRVIKASAPIICPILTQIFNNHLCQGIFPEELKIGNITPIYKKDDSQLIENYRPVSTLPIFGKIFEKIIYKYTVGYIIFSLRKILLTKTNLALENITLLHMH